MRWLAEFSEEGTKHVIQSVHYVTVRLAMNDGVHDAYLDFITILDDIPVESVNPFECNGTQSHYLRNP